MNGNDEVERLERNLERQLHWIAAADGKAGFGFAFATAMLGVLAATVPKNPAEWGIGPAIAAAFAMVLAIIALVLLSLATLPRVTGPKRSLIFWGGIAQFTVDQFKNAVSETTDAEYIADLAGQCHRNAEIASTKFALIRLASLCIYGAVLPWVAAVWLLYSRARAT